MEAFLGHGGNGRAESQNKVLFSLFYIPKMDAMRRKHVKTYLP